MYLYCICVITNRVQSRAKAIAKSTGCKGKYALMRLPYHNRVKQTVPDAMHTVKDCIEKLVYLLIGKYIYIYIYSYVYNCSYLLYISLGI